MFFKSLAKITSKTAGQLSRKKRIEMYKRDNEKDYVVIVNEAVRGQNQLFEKVIIDSQNLAVHFEGRVIPLEYR